MKKILKEIGKDVNRGLAVVKDITGKVFSEAICKASYPILGNLSYKIQKRISNKVDCYFPGHAMVVSEFTNFLLYYYASEKIVNIFSDSELSTKVAIISLGYNCLELCIRTQINENIMDNPFKYTNSSRVISDKEVGVASLLGKIVSLPFDYFANIKERIEKGDRK